MRTTTAPSAKRLGRLLASDYLPFRGYLKCPECGKNLTGSGSRSKSRRYYFYYHCSGKCKTRFRADAVRVNFMKELKKYRPYPEYLPIFREQLKRTLLENLQMKISSQEILMDRINEVIRKLQKVEELMLLGNITDSDYRRIKEDGEIEINILGDRITNAQRSSGNIDRHTKQMGAYLAKLNELFVNANANNKARSLVASFRVNLLLLPSGFSRLN